MAAAPEPAPTAPQVEGVTLEQYAGVSAALIEGFPLTAVLQSEGLDAGAWPRVSLRWSQRLAKDGAGGRLASAYRDTVGFARNWLGRRVAPLEDDMGAWFGFLNAWSAHPAPFDLLDELAMAPSDVSRIQGAWARRVEADEGLRRKALELAKKKPSAIPKVAVTRAELRPFPWTRKRVAEAEEPALTRPKLSSSFVGDTIGLERYASLHAELGQGKAGDAAVLAKQGLDAAGFAALEQRWQRRFGLDPTLAEDFRRLVRYYEARLKARAQKPEAAREIRIQELPARPRLADLAGTSLALDLPRGPALPFAREAERPSPRSAGGGTPAPAGGIRVAPPPGKLAGTSLALDLPGKPSMPFVESAPAASPVAQAPSTGKVERPPAHLSGTSLALDVPRAPALPFAAEREVLPTGGAPERSEKLGELSPDLRAALAGHVPAPSAPQPPALTLEQHASLIAEIALAPERAMEILGRYGLTPQAKVAADAHYRERVAASAEVRAAWDRAYRGYYEWLVASRQGR